MKRTFNRNQMILFALCVCILQVCMGSKMVQAKTSDLVTTLQSGKTYEFNLDQSGKKEKVKFVKKKGKKKKQDGRTVQTGQAILYINNKKVLTEKLSDMNDMDDAQILVVDTDASDKQMEIFLVKGYFKWAWVSEMTNITYYRYKNGKLTKVQDLYEISRQNACGGLTMIHAYEGDSDDKVTSLLGTNGKGKLYVKLCCQLGNGLDFAHYIYPLSIKNGKYKAGDGEFDLLDLDGWIRTASKGCKVYTTPGGSKEAFTLKKKDQFYLVKVCRKKNNVYIKIKNKAGKTGYVKLGNLRAKWDGSLHIGYEEP